MAFRYNRIKAFHLGWGGDVLPDLTYHAKISYNQTWGTPFKPLPEVLENFSAFVGFRYAPKKIRGWDLTMSGAFDIGEIYGDNLGLQIKIRKHF